MDRIVHPTAVDIGGGRRGFRSKDTIAGVPGTVVTATHLNAQQEEFLAVIEKSGLVPSGADLTQLAQAIRSGNLNFIETVGGTANAITATMAPPLTAIPAGMTIVIKPATSNTLQGPTLDIDGLGAKTIYYRGGVTGVYPNEFTAGHFIILTYDGVGWTLNNPITFLNRTVQRQTVNYVTGVGGTTTAITGNIGPAPMSLADIPAGTIIRLPVAAANPTGPVYLNLNGLGNVQIVCRKPYNGGGIGALQGGELATGQIVELVYDGVNWQMASPPTNTLIFSSNVVLLTSGSWVVPASCYRVYAELVGAGGGGAGTSTAQSGGGGGGGGGYASGVFAVTPGSSLPFVLGLGGTGSSGSGGAGGASSFNGVLSVTGGTGGIVFSVTPAGGAGGIGSGGSIALVGGYGTDGGNGSAYGGAGGAPAVVGGGAGRGGIINGIPGVHGGGGGGGYLVNPGVATGGNGGSAFLRIWY
jgi:hypothetical protein